MNKGFTLIELLIVIALISIMTGLFFMTNPTSYFATARDQKREAHVNAIYGAVVDYASRGGSYPGCLVLETEVNANNCSEYILNGSVPEDPLDGCEYLIKLNSDYTVGVKAPCVETKDEITAGEWHE